MEETNSQVLTEPNSPKPNKVYNWFDKVFKLGENKTTIKTEVLAGVTTFFAMCYIILANPSMMVPVIPGVTEGAAWDQVRNAIFIAGILGAVIGTLLMAFVARMPFAQASGMGLNSFFFSSFMTAAFNGGETPAEAYGTGLAIIFLSGAIFLLLSVTGLRKYIATALPDCLKKAIPAGIGLFIAFIGLKNSGLVVADQYTYVGIADFTHWSTAAPVIAFVIGVILVVILYKFKVKGAIAIGILATAILYYLMTWTLPNFKGIVGVGAFRDFYEVGFFRNMRFDLAFSGNAGQILNAIMLIVTFCLVDMFDTVGTLYGTAAEAGMLDEKGDPKRLSQCMLCDSIATVAGACLGTSTVTTYVESSTGVSEGGRTGLTSCVVALLFVVALFFSPFASMIPQQATAVALVIVGVLMLKSFAQIDLKDMTVAIPAFLTLVIMPLTYSIANGIAAGMITYVIIRLCTMKYDKRDIVVTVLSVLFILRFAFVFMGTIPTYA